MNNPFPGKSVGWKTFEGMVQQLRRTNRLCKKFGVTGTYSVQLPLKEREKK